MKLVRIGCTALLSRFSLSNYLKKIIWRSEASPPSQPFIIAHRGASGYCPENTFAAFDKSIEQGADYIELDIQLSLDGKLVVIHDPALDRTTNGKGFVKNWTYQDLRRLDSGSWFHEQYKNERIHCLEDIFTRYNGKAGLIIEMKKPSLYPGIEKKLAEALIRVSFSSSLKYPVIVQSFNENALKTFREYSPHIPIGMLVKKHPAGLSNKKIKRISEFAQFINPKINMVNRRLIQRIHSFGLGVLVWTVRDKQAAEKLRHFGVEGLITDYPDLFH
ncbi:glycerophosphoryl diester phosphodiesterase [Peribacillus deserti]|uniref:Glycerophosphoryl diester phosphodiesterase n=1 Tax=Peribacillus deserti TaxID=673318 RepID=A0ABS2QIY0_9BACI|nr:glycerophosphoryl diester phosphodiesterase [Peribacillus deserti]